MFNVGRFFGRYEIDEWRDEHTLVAAVILNQVAADLIAQAEAHIAEATWKNGLLHSGSFIARQIAPMVRETTEASVGLILADANTALGQIVEHQAVWSRQPEAPLTAPSAFEGWGDLAVAAGPLAGGAALAASVPMMAVTTTAAWFGLVTTTVISWPVAVGGSAVAAVAIATGVFNTAKIRSKTEDRLRRKLRDFITTALIQGTAAEPSVLQQVAETLAKAGDQAKALRC